MNVADAMMKSVAAALLCIGTVRAADQDVTLAPTAGVAASGDMHIESAKSFLHLAKPVLGGHSDQGLTTTEITSPGQWESTCDLCECISEDQPYWYFRTEAVVFRRRRMDERTFVVDGNNNRALMTTVWDTPVEVSGRWTLGRQFNDRNGIELVTWYEDGFQDYTSIQGAPGLTQPFFNQPAGVQLGGAFGLVELEYDTKILDIQLNYRHWLRGDDEGSYRLGFMAGPRYFRVSEHFNDFESEGATRGATPLDTVYSTWARNELVGGTIGGMLEMDVTQRLRLLSETKFTGACNFTEAENTLALQNGTAEFFRDSTSEQWFSGIVELNLVLTYKHNRHIEMFAGYNARYFWHMTSAPDVLSFNLNNTSKQNNELAFWVHGPTAGLQINF